ncbi:MAG: tRNA pseudouridine(38-40) synthase TruA [Alphaproteobacteria bacterium]|nr:tRNA pseudouridine(38-40) synthase TruA [Alphaproteobacteria bacterium]
MTHFRITVEYDGTPYVGWQRQDNGPSIQAALESALREFCGEDVAVHGAGRTDAGVHALGQVAHFDIARDTDAATVIDALNHFLRHEPISVLETEAVDEDFHARFSATRRHYRYRILNRRPRPTVTRGRVSWVPVPLDADAMASAAQCLVGEHDFSSFRASICQAKSPVKTLDRLDVSRHGDEIHVEASARSFLHHQVRNIVGTLELVGKGRWSADDVSAALDARDRAAAGPTAPACGLYLLSVDYGDV